MTQEIYNPNPGFSNPHIKDFDEYLNLYKESIENPETVSYTHLTLPTSVPV